jgi:alkaline phosphatase
MVADGMSPSVLPMAEHFSQLVRGKGLLWRVLIDRSEAARALVDMASLNSVITDSSSASSSWGSGTRIFNGWVNMLLEGAKLTPTAANLAAAIQQGLTRPWGFRSSGASSHLGTSPPTPAGVHIRLNPAPFVR